MPSIQVFHDDEHNCFEIELRKETGGTRNLVTVWYDNDDEDMMSSGFASAVTARLTETLREILEEHGGLRYAVR